MANQNYYKNQQAEFIDITKSDVPILTGYGIYVGTVKAIDTEFRSGRLYVYIPGFSSGNLQNPSSFPAVTYASPFLGRTLGLDTKAYGTFDLYGQTYGMHFPLPDIGSEVLCCFPDGQRQYGYWFACVTNKLSKNMVPDIGAISGKLLMPESVPSELKEYININQNYPVGEINEELQENIVKDWYFKDQRPLHLPRIIQLWNQGLDADEQRGILTSSAQRDAISNVYGFITPGRPINDPGKNPAILGGIRTRNLNETLAKQNEVTARLGGHSFVLDDGDFQGNNNLIRLRSGAGHQIILNDKEGFVYISTSTGKNWVELTKDGKILIYSQSDIAVRTQGSLQIHADEKINFHASEINFNATEKFNIQAPYFNVNALNKADIYSGTLNLQGKATILSSSMATQIKSSGPISISGSLINLNSDNPGASIRPPPQIPKYRHKDIVGVRLDTPNLAKYNLHNNPFIELWTPEPSPSILSINSIVPTHEPYNRTGQESRSLGSGLVNLTAVTNATDLAEQTNLYPGVANAIRNPVNQSKKAPVSSFIKQPLPQNTIGNLSKDELQAYMAQIGYSESSGNYQISNSQGYQGKYQLGSNALQDVGFVKPGTPQTQEALSNPNNWIGGAGKPANLQEFLNNPDIQEQAMFDYTKKNYTALKNLGLVNNDSSSEVVSGYMAGAHLGGANGVANWAKGGLDHADSNGSTISSYFQLGRYSQTQTSVIVASNASRQS